MSPHPITNRKTRVSARVFIIKSREKADQAMLLDEPDTITPPQVVFDPKTATGRPSHVASVDPSMITPPQAHLSPTRATGRPSHSAVPPCTITLGG
jgi:hypothetical protein